MKLEAIFPKSIQMSFNRSSRFIFFVFLFNTLLYAQLPTAQQIADQMKVGWNIGNTLEAICGENAWENPDISQRLIDSVKAAGFDAIRLPCAWDCHTTDGVINAAWIARVKEVVDYCINDSMYVILNIHWDGGWLENHVTTDAQETVNEKQHNYWTQIANYFKDYDEHLLFASANEPNVDNATSMAVLLSYHQTFINAVRATSANNSSRTLVIQGPNTDIEQTNSLMNTLPVDSIADRLIIEIHYYTPWQFCGMTEDADWGNMFYYWGEDYHSTSDVSRNATWGEEDKLDHLFGLMKTKFVDNGIPVIIGEYGVVKRALSGDSDQELHLASRKYYYGYLVESAVNKGIIPFNWDTGPYWNNTMGIFDRNTGAVVDTGLHAAIMKGVAMGSATALPDDKLNMVLPDKFRLEQNYPNPFNPKTMIKFSIPKSEFTVLKVYNNIGQEVSTIISKKLNHGNHTYTFNGNNLANGVYYYLLVAGEYKEVKKMILLK